ncbi:MAG: hypothetical protein ACK2U9_24030, partial [Anaerolineae bacterium]
GSYFGASSFYSLGWALAPLAGGVAIQEWGGPVLYALMGLLCAGVALLYHCSRHLTRPDWPDQNAAVEQETLPVAP